MYNSLAKEIMNFLDWDAPFYTYQRSVSDSRPYQIVKEDGKTVVICNCLGVSPDDISVTTIRENRTDYLVVSGETKNSTLNRNYNINCRFAIDIDSVDGIEWSATDGLLKIEISFKVAEKPKIDIKKK